MDKVLVEIYVPLLDRSFDMFIPLASPMYEVLELMKKRLQKCPTVGLSQMRTLHSAAERTARSSILTYRFMNLRFATVLS